MSKWIDKNPTGAIVLKDGSIFEGFGLGYVGQVTGEVCFNTAISGYQEIMTDPSYCSQIITFTFPHIGNVGVNRLDYECLSKPFISGVILGSGITSPSSWRSEKNLNRWLKENKIVAIGEVDTRAITNHIRVNGLIDGTIVNNPSGVKEFDKYLKESKKWGGIVGQDLAIKVSTKKKYVWKEPEVGIYKKKEIKKSLSHIVVIDYGIKKNILRCLSSRFNKITVVPCNYTYEEIKKLKPDGIVLSNGPGDPEATGSYAIKIIKEIIDQEIPTFGICLGHQILALALGGKTNKMHQGHHGANHPVKDMESGKVTITSMNHGFAVDYKSLPSNIIQTHLSLFDESNCGIKISNKPIFSVQHHPEASPGPNDSYYLFDKFLNLVERNKYA